MSCSNLTSGIAKGCNDQVGGITGVHATLAYYDGITPPDSGITVGSLDQNGVITRISHYDPGQLSNVNNTWNWVEADNGKGNLTETYNIGGTGNILGFHQSVKFFIPTTAEPTFTTLPYSHTLQNWVKLNASQNNLVIGVELDHHNPGITYEPKCFVFGLKQVAPGIDVILPGDWPLQVGDPAYFASGDKQTGIAYGDDNGYTIEIAANSKQPMFETSYMSLHTNQSSRYYIGTNQGTDLTNGTFNLSGLEYFLGANIRQLGTTGMFPEIYVMPGERLTVGAYVTADWVADVTNNGFEVEAYMLLNGIATQPVLNTVGFTGSGAGVAEAYFTGSWENTTNDIVGVLPIKLRATNGFTGNLNNPPFVPYVRFDQITRTTRS